MGYRRQRYPVSYVGASGGGDVTPSSILNLASDSRVYADEPTAFPIGYSSMPASDYETPGTFGAELAAGLVVTRRWVDGIDSSVQAVQTLLSYQSDRQRHWEPDVEEWSTWTQSVTSDMITAQYSIPPFGEDSRVEATGPADYAVGYSIVPVSGEADWNGTGHYGFVETIRNVEETFAVQTFTDAEAAGTYTRHWIDGSSVWSAWS